MRIEYCVLRQIFVRYASGEAAPEHCDGHFVAVFYGEIA